MRALRGLQGLSVGVVLVLLGATACGDDDTATPMLLVGTAAGIAVLDGATGTLGAPAATAASTPDGSLLVRSEPIGTRTTLRAVVIANGEDRWTSTLEGSLEPRVVSGSGDRVALTPPPGVLEPGAVVPGRASTELVVARDDGSSDRYDLAGNIEPEAFSLDGTGLFVVSFLPPEVPTHYQVQRLDLETGEVGDVYTPDAHLQTAMQGVARTQVWDPDGSRLYTLYTQQVDTEVVAFVHVLDLDEQWAHCIGLPAGFTATSAGLALDGDARRLYVADSTGGVVAAVDTESLHVDESAELPAGPTATASPVAVVDDELLVGSGTSIRRLDRSSLESLGTVVLSADVLGILPSTREDEVFVASTGLVELRNLDSGDVLQRVRATPSVGSFTGLGARSTSAYAGITCAC